MEMGGWKKKKGDGKKEEEIIRDPRFAGVHRDPRFHKVGKHKSKVKIDDRFNRMFTDKAFASSSAAPVDKRGKSISIKYKNKDSAAAAADPLERYYHHLDLHNQDKEDEDIDNSTAPPAAPQTTHDDEDEEDEESSDSAARLQTQSEDDDDDHHSTASDSDGVFSHLQQDAHEEENVPLTQKETHRLALVNMDWNQVKAVDLYVLFNSFLPKAGQILSVTVYPTDFGLKRMEEEAVQGPVGLFDKDDQNESEDDGDDEFDVEKLRAYELSRLKYYHAVVECDSIATADYLYSTCDGVEFERSSNKLDLRFIPDEMEFKHAPRDVATEAPGGYEGIDFQTRALQQSKINLTWDEDEPQRSRTLKRKFKADQLAELELKEFLASDESETDEGENLDGDMEDLSAKRHKKLDKYRALMLSGDGSDRDEENNDQDMEVTFNTGLEDISKRILEKKDKKSETVWEAYLRSKKEKKKARKNKSKDSSEDEGSDTDREPTEEPDDFFVEDTHVRKCKVGRSAGKRKETQETADKAQASVAELELLLADVNGDTNLKGYNLKPKKAKGRKGKKEVIDEGKIPSVDPTNDPRFSALLTSHHFALDPTDPEFRRSATYARQVAHKQHKGERELGGNEHSNLHGEAHSSDGLEEMGKDEQILGDGLSTKKDKHELSSLVKSIKMKSKQLQESNNDKVSRKKGKNKLAKKSRVL